MIEAKHVEEAARRWQDFLATQAAETIEAEVLIELWARCKAGEDRAEVIEDVKSRRQPSAPFAAAQGRLERDFLGLTEEARHELRRVIADDDNRPGRYQRGRDAIDYAMTTGCMIGFFAARLAQEEQSAQNGCKTND